MDKFSFYGDESGWSVPSIKTLIVNNQEARDAGNMKQEKLILKMSKFYLWNSFLKSVKYAD